MCESSVFMKEGDAERLVFEDVVLVRSLKDGLYIEDILGRSREVAGRIELIDLVNHRIIITDQ
jgi:predicted RNA-binding protein